MFKSIGTGRFGGWIQLLPEEALYMVERGNLDMRVAEGDGMEAWRGIPLSVQHCYALLLGQEGLTAERYTVYTGLKRLGMAVQRAPTWDQERNSESVEVEVPDGKAGPTAGASGFFSWIYGLLSNGNTHKSPPLGPLVGIGCYRSFGLLSSDLWHIEATNDVFQRIFIDYSTRSPTTTLPSLYCQKRLLAWKRKVPNLLTHLYGHVSTSGSRRQTSRSPRQESLIFESWL